jgi:Fur family ferric uptake transcriptional regulator
MASETRRLRGNDTRQLLKAKGLRFTQKRLMILRELSRLSRPVSHTELTERLEGRALDRATIYRNLVALAEAGILVRTRFGDNVWRYGLPGDDSEHAQHPHFVCNDCGEVVCLPASAVTLRGAVTRNEVAEVQLRGRCLACAKGSELLAADA